MLGSKIGKKILDGFCLTKLSSEAEIDFGVNNVYLGLLTVLPNNDESAYEDGTFFKEPIDEEYHRIQLNAMNPLKQMNYTDAAAEDTIIEVEPGVEALPTYVTNPTYIMFPEALADWGAVVGFGLFEQSSGTTLPYLWGPITALDGESTVTILAEEVPIIRAGNFKISLR